jgi:hypothetical protein
MLDMVDTDMHGGGVRQPKLKRADPNRRANVFCFTRDGGRPSQGLGICCVVTVCLFVVVKDMWAP